MESWMDRRRTNAPVGGGLRRSRSVRASIRLLGNRWKSQKSMEPSDELLNKSNPEEVSLNIQNLAKNEERLDNNPLVDYQIEGNPDEFLKESIGRIGGAKSTRNGRVYLRSQSSEKFTSTDRNYSLRYLFVSNKSKEVDDVPARIAPKAASLLQTPIEGDCKSVSPLRREIRRLKIASRRLRKSQIPATADPSKTGDILTPSEGEGRQEKMPPGKTLGTTGTEGRINNSIGNREKIHGGGTGIKGYHGTHANAHGHAHVKAHGFVQHAHGHAHAQAHGHAHAQAHDVQAQAHGHAHVQSHGHAHAQAHGHAHAQSHGHPHAQAHGHAHVQSHGHLHAQAHGHAHAHAHGHVPAKAHTHVQALFKANAHGHGPGSFKPATIRRNSMWTSKLQSLESSNRAELAARSGPAPRTAMEQRAPNPPLTKASKKLSKQAQARLDKLAQINIHLHALFAAVEHGHLEKARTILESTDVDVNSVNNDGLSPLDVAVLNNNRPLAKMLVNFGAREGNQFKSPESLGSHLKQLLQEAEHRVQELGGATLDDSNAFNTRASFSSIIGNAYPATSVTGCAGSGDADKQLTLWERRAKVLRRMLLGFDQARPPDPPYAVDVDVTGVHCVTVRFQEAAANDSAITTKFKVQWSSRADFSNICGEREVLDVQQGICRVAELTQGRRYFFRAACGNLKGWGEYRNSTPSSVVPSSWRDVEHREPRFAGRLRLLDDLFGAVRLARPEDASDIPLETPAMPRRNQKKKTTIKQLFTAASKFQKTLRRGVYLACILYHEDKVLVTNEDFLPVIEVDESYPSCIHTDYHWLMKVACTWDDVKSLRTDMEKNASSAIHFRTKLLSAAAQMQSALCIQDLGQLFHRPLRDSQGTLVISCINFVKTPKSVSVLNSRWLPLNKVHKKINVLQEENINDVLMASIQEQITYHQVSSIKLTRGLYLGYLKLQSSVDLIQVVVQSKTPNVLPHCKIRDNPNVSAEEWEYLKHQQRSNSKAKSTKEPTEVQLSFLDMLTSAANRLFKYMDISCEDALTHRLYDVEVIDLNSEVSFILVCPPAEFSCAVPGQREILLQRGDLLSLPIQAFEMIHLKTYQHNIIQRYSRLSCILELDIVMANHLHREAFSTSELQTAKERLNKLQELQASLNSVWKGVRWLMDVIGFARDRGNVSAMLGIQMKSIFKHNKIGNQENVNDNHVTTSANSSLKRSLLQLPPRDPKLVKSSPGRGSWPGPAISNSMGPSGVACLLATEFSKSEQHLSVNPRDNSMSNLSGSQYLSATSDGLSGLEQSSRKSSADSNYTQSSVGQGYYARDPYSQDMLPEDIQSRLPPSRSEDTLLMIKQPPPAHRKRATTLNSSVSARSSPLLSARPLYSGSMGSVNTGNTATTSESMHSLSSDSESTSCPITTSTPNRNVPGKSVQSAKGRTSLKFRADPGMPTSRSMSNVKQEFLESSEFRSRKQLFEADDGFRKPTPDMIPQTSTYLKPTLNAIQNEARAYRETLHITEENQPFRETPRCSQPTERAAVTLQQAASTTDKANKAGKQGDQASDVASSSGASSFSSQITETSSNNPGTPSPMPGILQVYAAYETGLASGTSLKLHVTPRTSAREVVDLVVKQLNMAVVLKGKDGPIYTSDKLQNFCLVAVIGARERCLRDDFKPLQLQNPWRKGRLYVRQKHDVLAAIEHSTKHSVFL